MVDKKTNKRIDYTRLYTFFVTILVLVLIINTLAVSVPVIWAMLFGNSSKMSMKEVLWTKQVIVKHPYRWLRLLLTS